MSCVLQVVELLLSSNLVSSLLACSPADTADNDRTTFLHLAAKNGHADVIRSVVTSSRKPPFHSPLKKFADGILNKAFIPPVYHIPTN